PCGPAGHPLPREPPRPARCRARRGDAARRGHRRRAAGGAGAHAPRALADRRGCGPARQPLARRRLAGVESRVMRTHRDSSPGPAVRHPGPPARRCRGAAAALLLAALAAGCGADAADAPRPDGAARATAAPDSAPAPPPDTAAPDSTPAPPPEPPRPETTWVRLAALGSDAQR